MDKFLESHSYQKKKKKPQEIKIMKKKKQPT